MLHSSKWAAWLIARLLWQRASQQLEQWTQAAEEGWVIGDESVWEKRESQHLEGLGAVRSSKAKRLTHDKQGSYSPPLKPIFVPGLQWIGVWLVGRSEQQGPPLLAAIRWWSSRGPHSSFKRDEEANLLLTCAAQWGRQVVHVFDQGFAGGFWLSLLLTVDLRFVLRWRYDKSELAFQSPRLWHWAEREKLLLMATLAYAFRLSLLSPCYDLLRLWLLHQYGHRTGWHCREVTAPLYRLRNALSRLWQPYPPNFALLGQRHLPSVRLLAAEAHADRRSTPFSA